MASSKIIFEETDYTFMLTYKEYTGVSVQKFVTDAVKEKREKIEIEQYLKDLPYLKED